MARKPPTILLISGTARSGTTAMSHLLNAHSRMVITNERHYNRVDRLPVRQSPPETLFSPEDFSKEKLLWPTRAETHNARWADGGPEHRAMLARYDNAAVIGDKVPEYHRIIDHLFARLPGARLVFMLRNVFDVAASWQARHDDRMDTVWKANHRRGVEMWNRDNRLIGAALARYRKRIAVVSYERLFSYSPAYLKAVLKFAGAPPGDRAIHETYRQMTVGWMTRFAAPHPFTPAERGWIADTADFAAYQGLIDLGEPG